MTEFADLEISLQRHDQGSFQARLSFRPPGSDARRRIPPQVLRFDREALDALSTNPAAYGQTLAEQLFAADPARTFFAEARATAASQDVPLRVRLQIDPQADQLHELRWETLGDPDPEADGFLCTSERLLFSRYISSADRRLVAARPRGDLRALVVIANPSDIGECQDEKGVQLAPVPVAAELARAHRVLNPIPVTALCSEPALEPAGKPTLNEMLSHLRDGFGVLYLVAHGALSRSGKPLLWLEDEEGKAGRIVATDTTPPGRGVELGLLSQLDGLPRLPRLVILASCESAGDGGEEAEPASRDTRALAALGPRLAEIGVPAVVAMQGSVTMKTVEQFMPILFTELLRDGQIDRAVAAARRAVHERWDWWMPVLYSRLESGRLFADEPQPEPEGRLAAPGGRSAIPAPWTVPFPRNDRFVGRQDELEALHHLLQGDRAAAPVGIPPVGISGMGGIGKTQLAVEYAYRHRDDYPGGIFWVNAARVQDWAGELVALADRARLTGHAASVRAVALTPDGQRAVSASHDRTLRLWDLDTGAQLATVALDGRLVCVAVVPGDDAAAGAVTLLAGDAAGNVYGLRYVEPDAGSLNH